MPRRKSVKGKRGRMGEVEQCKREKAGVGKSEGRENHEARCPSHQDEEREVSALDGAGALN